MYHKLLDEKIYEDINKRKEFIQYKQNDLPDPSPTQPNDIPIINEHITEFLSKETYMMLKGSQLLINHFMSLNTPYNRILIKHDPGTGKTLLSLSIALDFVKMLKNIYMSYNKIEGNIVILGFSADIFIDELLKYPQFGFITHEEIKELKKMKKIADNGTKYDIDKYIEYRGKIKRRLSNKKMGGFFQFYGYKKFVNELFNLKNLDKDFKKLSENDIIKMIKSGEIKINNDVLDLFRGRSLLICDEVHDTYNSVEKNNWGIAIQIILDRFPDLKVLLLSATPINNSPTETIDLLNLLSPKKYTKDDFFIDNRTLKPGAEEKIANLLIGKVSFLRDSNVANYPSSKIIGEKIPIPHIKFTEANSNLESQQSYNFIPYLKFIRCPMSSEHLEKYKEILNIDSDKLSNDGYALLDFILPSPDGWIYTTKDIKKLLMVDQKWKDENQIDVYIENNEVMITGEILRNKLNIISSKYFSMLNNIKSCILNKKGKIMIYHDMVHMSGIYFIREILNRNGFIDENVDPNDNTMCSKCSIIRKEHTNPDHEFIPCRYIMYHGGIEKNLRKFSLDKFNHFDNRYGHNYMILLGSKAIKQSVNVKCCQNLIIAKLPSNISTLIQVMGRVKRNESHIDLEPERRNVEISIYVSSLAQSGGKLSYEENIYYKKILDYLVIQKIEKVFNENAIDSHINRNIIMANAPQEGELGMLYFDEKHKPSQSSQERAAVPLKVITSTFNVYYIQEEVKNLIYIIKRIFLEHSTVWTYVDLWKFVQSLPSSLKKKMPIDTTLINENSFIVALDTMVYTATDTVNVLGMLKNKTEHIIEKLVDVNDKFIYINNQNYVIVQIDLYYILVPYVNGKAVVNIESCFRTNITYEKQLINVNDYISDNINVSYEQMKYIFYNKYNNIDIKDMSTMIVEYGYDFHLRFIEDAIAYSFNAWTNPSTKLSEFHDFYFKMIYYYDRFELIIFASGIHNIEFLKNTYNKYISNLKTYKIQKDKHSINISSLQALLITSLEKSGKKFNIEKFNLFLNDFRNINKLENNAQITKVNSNFLPIGHFISKIPRFYEPQKGWFNYPEYSAHFKDDYIENNIIVGYYEKSSDSFDVKFKLRKPISYIKKQKDARLTERGNTCENKKIEELEEIADKFKIEHEGLNKKQICHLIKKELLTLELKERQKKPLSKIKWFYFYFEKQPDIE